MGRILDRAQEIAEESFIAASGPGGQNVNKVASAVQLRVNIYRLGLPPQIFHRLKQLAGSRLNAAGEIVIDARNHRTQEANRREARERLAALVDTACKPVKKRRKSTVNRPNKGKRLQDKKELSQKKQRRGKIDW